MKISQIFGDPTEHVSSAQAYSPKSPAKKQSKWSQDEDVKIIEFRGNGIKWEDISKQLPGRSAISYRLHYQNYLERRREWDEDRKNKLARLYESFKADMWPKIAEEMTLPWRVAEAIHWQIGEHEMARRAGATAFLLSSNHSDNGHANAAAKTEIPQLPLLAELTARVPANFQPGTRPMSRVHNLNDLIIEGISEQWS